jgi:hypothetical protein
MIVGKDRQRRIELVQRVRDALYTDVRNMTMSETKLVYVTAVEPRGEHTPANYFPACVTSGAIERVMRDDLLFRTKICRNYEVLAHELDDESYGNVPDVIIVAHYDERHLSSQVTALKLLHPDKMFVPLSFVRKGVTAGHKENVGDVTEYIIYPLFDDLVRYGVLTI